MTKRELIKALEALECSEDTLVVTPAIDGQGTYFTNEVISVVFETGNLHITLWS